MYEQSPLQQPQLSSLEQFGQPQIAGVREYAQQFAGQSPVAQQPQQVAGVQQPTQQYAQQPQIQQGQQPQAQSPVQQSPVQQTQQPQQAQQPQQGAQTQYGQQSLQPSPQQQSLQPTPQQFQQPSLPSQFGGGQSSWAQTPERTQIPQFGQTPPTQQFGQIPQQTGHVQQIPVGSVAPTSPQQIPVEHGQHSAQQTPWRSAGQHELTRQTVEMADTPLLADALARRLGLTSQQLAQVLPQLGAALGAQAYGQQGVVGQQAAMPQQSQFPIQSGIQR